MRRRTPLVVAVVGALLVGGATTGTTLALWRDQVRLPTGSLTSASMGSTVLNGGDTRLGFAEVVSGGSAATVTGTVRDTSSDGAKNLRQGIRLSRVELVDANNGLSLSDLRLSVGKAATTGCSGAAPTTPALGYSTAVLHQTAPAVPDRTFGICVDIAATPGAPTSSGTLALHFAGQQVRPDGSAAGWASSTAAALEVSVTGSTPAAPALECDTSVPTAGLPGYRLTWIGNGTTYKVHRASSQTGPFTLVSTQVSSSYTDPDFAKGEVRYFRVRAVNASGDSTDSNVLKVVRSGNSDNFKCGAP